jgi:ATP-dependent DNA ligase
MPLHAKRSGIQLAYPFEERRLLNQGRFRDTWTPPYIVQPKLDGERCRALVQQDRCILLSSTEEIIASIPHINEQMLNFPPGEYDGELYVHGMKWNEIHSIVSREINMHENSSVMEYHIFDIIKEDWPQSNRSILLGQYSNIYNFPNIKFVDAIYIKTTQELYRFYSIFIAQGYEGFIIRAYDSLYTRRRTPLMMKFKPKCTDTYRCIGIEEAISESGTPLAMIGAFICQDPEGTRFKVGAGEMPHTERSYWFKEHRKFGDYLFENAYLTIKYHRLSDKLNIPLHSVAVEFKQGE